MRPILVACTRALLALVALGTALSMFLAPLLAAEVGAQYPEVRGLAVPYSVLAVLALLAVEVALVAVWHLLGLAARDEVFDPRALRSVTVVIGCVVTVATLAATVFGHLTFGAQLGGPLVLLGLLGSLVGGGALALLVVVLRALLRAATADRRELAAVI
ncbi:DUF2975 domain-containing protein [Cellulosimicrobium sp. TH-20]|uniref:DUF2975 domain-containing protein n=1 Tax=Cellulosimicrobium sp. TH-20 TaxID=1980001 RepID=UPI0011AB2343|nr:DUF2975 domain-containing protein [Cellulosimicrobium sp. TH-20]